MIQRALADLLEGRDLSQSDARDVMRSIMAGEATPGQIGGFLVALRLKGETADEIAGCAEAMREHEIAATADDEEVMAVRHRELAVHGVQFHPESVLTPLGPQLGRNFLEVG